MLKRFQSPTQLSKSLALAFGSIVLSTGAYAQTQAAPTQKQDRIEVTGSNVKRTDIEGALPIQVITAEEIKRSGKLTITDVLRELPSNAAGGLTELTGSGSFSAGAASASLRGLGSAATLVLLNGRRIAPYGLVDPNFGQSAVVNLNALPLDVIERIEILKDGASAIYGSEAIAGVINIILRKDFKGGQVGASFNTSDRGLFKSNSATLTYGKGDLGQDKYNIFANVEVFSSKGVKFKQIEGYLNTQLFRGVYGTGVPSSSFGPAMTLATNSAFTAGVRAGPGATCATTPANAFLPGTTLRFLGATAVGATCLYDQWEHVIVAPDTDRVNFFSRGTVELPGEMTAFGELSINKTKVFFAGAPGTVGSGVGNWFVANTGALNRMPTTLPVGHPNNPTNAPIFYRWRSNAIGDQNRTTDSTALRALVGLKGTNFGWDWETALLHTNSVTKVLDENLLRGSVLINGVANGTLNFLAPNIKSILGTNTNSEAKSGFTNFEVKGSRELFKLPGGNASLATGFEFRNESRVANPDPQIPAGEVVGRGVARADASRNVTTVFGEIVLPVTSSIELQVAARSDKYGDSGKSSFTPKVSGSWKVLEALKFRGSVAEGFRAPSLTESAQSSTSGFFNGIDDPKRCDRAKNITIGCGVSMPGLIVASPFLEPEKAKSSSFGIVIEPTRDLSVSVDYFDIRRRNEITFLGLTEILTNEGSTDPRYANKVVRDPTNVSATVPNDPGAVLFVRTGFDNLGLTTVQGVDLDARFKVATQTAGKFSFRLASTYYTKQSGSGAPNAPVYDFNGYRNAPKFRGTFSTEWDFSNVVTTLTANYLSSHASYSNPEVLSAAGKAGVADCGNPINTYLGICRIAAYTTVDLGLTYTGIKNLRVGLVVRNIGDALPPIDPQSRPLNFGFYSPAGRTINVNARYSF